MLDIAIAEAALDAACDFDMLRLGKPDRRGGVGRLALVLRTAFPRDEDSIVGRVCPMDLVVINEVLGLVNPAQRVTVRDVIRDVNATVDDIVDSWERHDFQRRHVHFLLTLSRMVAAKSNRYVVL